MKDRQGNVANASQTPPFKPTSSYLLLRGVLMLVALPPLVVGIAGVSNGGLAVKWYSFFSRATVTLTPEMNYLLSLALTILWLRPKRSAA